MNTLIQLPKTIILNNAVLTHLSLLLTQMKKENYGNNSIVIYIIKIL